MTVANLLTEKSPVPTKDDNKIVTQPNEVYGGIKARLMKFCGNETEMQMRVQNNFANLVKMNKMNCQ